VPKDRISTLDCPNSGRCLIVREIGAGGLGVVCRAHNEQLDRDVALKVHPAGLLADEAARKRFRNEALALTKLNHPDIKAVHDFGSERDLDFLVMELIHSVPLSQKIRDGPLHEMPGVPAEATRLGCGRCQFEARLALAEVERKQGKRPAARERFAALEKDDASKGFLLAARQ
jgi:hypothetical protein